MARGLTTFSAAVPWPPSSARLKCGPRRLALTTVLSWLTSPLSLCSGLPVRHLSLSISSSVDRRHSSLLWSLCPAPSIVKTVSKGLKFRQKIAAKPVGKELKENCRKFRPLQRCPENCRVFSTLPTPPVPLRLQERQSVSLSEVLSRQLRMVERECLSLPPPRPSSNRSGAASSPDLPSLLSAGDTESPPFSAQ